MPGRSPGTPTPLTLLASSFWLSGCLASGFRLELPAIPIPNPIPHPDRQNHEYSPRINIARRSKFRARARISSSQKFKPKGTARSQKPEGPGSSATPGALPGQILDGTRSPCPNHHNVNRRTLPQAAGNGGFLPIFRLDPLLHNSLRHASRPPPGSPSGMPDFDRLRLTRYARCPGSGRRSHRGGSR